MTAHNKPPEQPNPPQFWHHIAYTAGRRAITIQVALAFALSPFNLFIWPALGAFAVFVTGPRLGTLRRKRCDDVTQGFVKNLSFLDALQLGLRVSHRHHTDIPAAKRAAAHYCLRTPFDRR